jgi:peptidyl-prolyl cis-trans isomerase B (cyclophilin B)
METANPMVLLKTSRGDITIELDAEHAPESTANFLRYIEENHFDGTIFHRVIPGFMIQGGGMTTDMLQKPTHEPIRNEAANGLKNMRGTIAMARTQVIDSGTCQFFINLADNHFLDHQEKTAAGFGYAVFGKVVAGIDTIDAIAAVSTGRRGYHENVPLEPVVIEQCRVVEQAG